MIFDRKAGFQRGLELVELELPEVKRFFRGMSNLTGMSELDMMKHLMRQLAELIFNNRADKGSLLIRKQAFRLQLGGHREVVVQRVKRRFIFSIVLGGMDPEDEKSLKQELEGRGWKQKVMD
jgi:hypothetical protein